jgi:tRNA-Thr(GGU) m(6)t(6)A37 methyltransferase TsaA
LKTIKGITLKPIGIVKNNLGKRKFDNWQNTESIIEINKNYQKALYRLDDFSHINVIFYLHQFDEEFEVITHPTGNPKYPLVGAFATRTPNRPNRIGLTTCELIEIKGNVLKVKGLDAFDGSPVIDIKPYAGKNIENFKIPQWINDVSRERSHTVSKTGGKTKKIK